ncbi:helix-turn-helix domain-containing protein [Virgisporangium aurantiacum]|nr:helix-turn-helix domain-containing protein [Virgisporangium aurantiacum]
MLVREAPRVEFDRPLLEARAVGASADALAALDRARELALEVRALLDRRRRREAELSALFDTVADLATLRDLDAVLEAIVRRARKLLDTDVTYMTLNDPDRGDTYMRVTDGSVSARFQRLRLPMGAGLGGLAAQLATPFTTSSYLGDPRFRHTEEIDTAVQEEGIVAILGVPMRLGARVVGVLYAANRTARPFERPEIALLTSLAAHAAVAIDNTRLLTETRAALAELGTANTLSREHSLAIERAADAHDRLAGLVLRGVDVRELATTVAELLGGAIIVLDAGGRRLVTVGDISDAVSDAALAEAVAEARVQGRAVRRGDLRVAAVGAGGEPLCALALCVPGELSETDERTLERAAVVTALLLLVRRSVTDTESRVRGELLEDLVVGRGDDPAVVLERARRLGVDLDRPHVVVVFSAEARYRQRASSWAAGQASARGGLAGRHDGDGVLLLPGNDTSGASGSPGSPGSPGDEARRVARELGAVLGSPVTAGGAGPVGPDEVAAAYVEAARCVSALRTLGRTGDGVSAADLGFVGLLLGQDNDITTFLAATIGPVLEYDARRRTALADTLRAYFDTGSSPARAAERLHVHVNTVNQRLDRISQLLGTRWQRPDHALEVQLALKLHALRASLPGT